MIVSSDLSAQQPIGERDHHAARHADQRPSSDAVHAYSNFSSSARSGSSPAGAVYDAASEAEGKLIRMGSPVSTNMLPVSEPGSPIGVHVHALRLRHVCHGDLRDHAGVSPPLGRTAMRPLAYERGRRAVIAGRPVRARMRSSFDSRGAANVWRAA